jgi:hypothetical protein
LVGLAEGSWWVMAAGYFSAADSQELWDTVCFRLLALSFSPMGYLLPRSVLLPVLGYINRQETELLLKVYGGIGLLIVLYVLFMDGYQL